jgi:O-antigen biosynthesis protein
MMRLSVVICTRDRSDLVGAAVDSVAQCAYPAFDIHVMDQSTDDRTRCVVEQLAARHAGCPPIHYHHLERPGLSRAYNAGMQVSEGEVIACTDDDVIVPPNWLDRIAAAFRADAGAGLLYGQVLVPESLKEAAGSSVIVPALPIERRERLCRGQRFHVFGMGANMAVRRDLLADVAGFDEALGGGGPLRSSQDFDFAYRTFRAGWAIMLEPDVCVDHYGTRTHEQWPDTMRNYGIGDGGFYSKHIRCGDLYALWLLARVLVRSRAREVVRSLRSRRWTPDIYGRSILLGIRQGRRFPIDRPTRVYRAIGDAPMAVTDSNRVTGSGPPVGPSA